MARSRSRKSNTRRTPRAHPRGVLELCGGGFGFVQTAEGEFFIPASKVADAFDGDMVEVTRLPGASQRSSRSAIASNNRPAARVVRVLSRAHECIVGRYEVAEPFGIVVPEDPRIKHDVFTLRSDAPHVRNGDIVRVRMTVYPSRREPAQGVVEEVLGHEGDVGIDVSLIVARHKLETHFGSAALQQAGEVREDAEDALSDSRYVDLSKRRIFTIDPDDAKDFDDALSIEPFGDGRLLLGVHIADVSHYVPWGSPLDIEARRRATSVYLVDRVIPMLPEQLSNDVCSLRPGRLRRAMTVDMVVDPLGNVSHVKAYPSVIRSAARLTYGQAQSALSAYLRGDLEGAADALECLRGSLASDVASDIVLLHEAAEALHENRVKRGGIDFESVEAKVALDEGGRPLGVDLRVKNDATSLVEEAMIATNEAVARLLRDRGVACIYRTHEQPAPADMAELKPVLQEFGYEKHVSLSALASGNPRAIQRVLSYAKGRREEYLVSMLMIRTMKRAAYQDCCAPHFGLASNAYAHFTSPIRRYPDLMVHRMVKVALFGRTQETSAVESAMAAIADHASVAERTAEVAARESQELKLYELLETRIGEEAQGLISGVMSSGFFVRLDDTSEGFVSLRGRDEYYVLNAARRTLTGSDSGSVYRLGMRVRIRIAAVSPYERRADFILLESKRRGVRR